MRRMLALVTAIACGLAGMSTWAQQHTWVVIEAGGQERGAFVPGSAPYTKHGPSVDVFLFDRKDVRTREGQALTGFEFIGWTEGAATRVQVFALVPKNGVPNTYLPKGDARNLQRRDFASYLVVAGQPQSIAEMTALGVPPMVLRTAMREVQQ